MRRPLVSVSALLIALALPWALAACGGDDTTAHDSSGGHSSAAPGPGSSTPADPASSSGGSTGLHVTDGISPEALLSCLKTAGIDAEVAPPPAGVTDPVEEIELTGMTAYDGSTDQGGYLYVFEDPAHARANADAVTLGGVDDPSNNRFAISGNVVRELSIIMAAKPTDDEAMLLSCIPG